MTNDHPLFRGIRTFCENEFKEYQELFRSLGKEQKPHTLFIGCSDSRVVPNLITRTLPGELFMIRNIANLVPFYRDSNEFLSTTSAIEYAVVQLNVANIVVCGHSNCGGCRALYMDEQSLQSLPHTRKWLELAKPVIKIVSRRTDIASDSEKRSWITEQLNIVEQMNHLLSYPYILAKKQSGELMIYGWYYIIETGEIFNYDDVKGMFVKI